VAALDTPATHRRAYNLGGGDALPLVDLVRAAARAVGRRPRLVHLPTALALVAARARALPVSVEQIRRLAEDKAVDNAPAERDLGVRPRPFAEGVRLEARALGLAPVHSPAPLVS
jgi:nucleoside-diphosphate-sugar epimerase